MTSKIKHKIDKYGRTYIEIGSPEKMRKVLDAAFEKFSDDVVAQLFPETDKDKKDE